MIVALAVLWAALNAVDLAETLYALSIGHVEQNPIAAALYDAFGPAGLVGYKLVLVVAVFWAAYRARERHPLAVSVLLLAAVYLMIFVVVHNADVLGGIQ